MKGVEKRKEHQHPSKEYGHEQRELTPIYEDMDEDIPYPSEEMVYVVEGSKEMTKQDLDNIPVHEKELNIFEKILYENKTQRNTVRNQKDRRKKA